MRIPHGTTLENGARVIQASKLNGSNHNVVLAKWGNEFVVWRFVNTETLQAECGSYFDSLDDAWVKFCDIRMEDREYA